MKKLQRWFETLAGITADELHRLSLAERIYARETVDLRPLDKPACWRRPSRVRGLR